MKIDEDYLKHFGIMGMRWGKRRGKSEETKSNKKSLRAKKANDRDQRIANEQKAKAKELVDFWVKEEKESKLRRGKTFDEKKARKRAEKDAYALAGLNVNASIKSVRKERIKDAAIITASALLILGNVGLKLWVKSKQNQMSSQLIDNLIRSSTKGVIKL